MGEGLSMSDLSITELLEAYGQWCRDDNNELGCKSPSLMLIKQAPHLCKDSVLSRKSATRLFISDDDALAVDRAMGALIDYSLVLYNIAYLKFVDGHSDRNIAKYYLSSIEYPDSDKQVPHTAVKPLLTEGLGFVNGYLIRSRASQ